MIPITRSLFWGVFLSFAIVRIIRAQANVCTTDTNRTLVNSTTNTSSSVANFQSIICRLLAQFGFLFRCVCRLYYMFTYSQLRGYSLMAYENLTNPQQNLCNNCYQTGNISQNPPIMNSSFIVDQCVEIGQAIYVNSPYCKDYYAFSDENIGPYLVNVIRRINNSCPRNCSTRVPLSQYSIEYLEANNSGIVTLNCIIAKQVCIDDPMCGPTLDIVDRVCGSEVVSCSTVTVTKCQAALKTLQTFPFFNPTCLCREPQLDQKCNSFRTFLFDHPCLFANRREKDPYPIDSLVSCTHAHSICKSDPNCSRIYDNFKHVCRTNDEDKCIPELQFFAGCVNEAIKVGKLCQQFVYAFRIVERHTCGESSCRSSEACKESWSKMRLTPMFGCICPPNLWQGQKKCDRHFNFVNHNRCAGSDLPIEANDVLMNFQSTCYQAMDMCQKNKKCATAISAIVAHCSSRDCKRQKCRHSLQMFYRNKSLIKYAVEIAFCLCKKTNNTEEDECMRAQDTLHPSCAQEVDTITPPTCHSVAEGCRADAECLPLLEEFEQLCATDNYTKTCAGHPQHCRIGMLGILGTKLRTNCVCKGTDRAKLYECVGWQRVLWFNPCVVEAQREFHMNKVRARLSSPQPSITGVYEEESTTVAQTVEVRTTAATATSSTTPRTTAKKTTTTTASTTTTTTTFATTKATTPTTFLNVITRTTFNKSSSTTPVTTTRTSEPNTKIFRSSNNGLSNVINRGRDNKAHITSPSPINVFLTPLTEGNHRIGFERTTTSTTTKKPVVLANSKSRKTTKPTIPPHGGCVLQKTTLDDEMFVAEGKATRFYHDLENDCSEMCYCAPGSILRCQTECIQPHSCKTDIAMYKHGAPAYQAFRGRCLCYSAKFICMRPKLDTYTLPAGVFLYLGYSSLDEELMSKHVHFEIRDSVQELQELMNKNLAPEAPCSLSLFSVAEENAIVLAKFRNQSSNFIRFTNVKPTLEEVTEDKVSCFTALESLAKAINEQHYDVKTNVFLSIFKLAEVDVTYPPSSDTTTARAVLSLIFLQFILILVIND